MEESYLHSDLTEKIIGFAFDIYNQIGPRYPEYIYQRAFETKFKDNNIPYQRECYCRLELDGKKIAAFRLDFLVSKSVVLELKVRDYPLSTDMKQILTYMNNNKIEVGLIVRFTTKKVEIKRLVL